MLMRSEKVILSEYVRRIWRSVQAKLFPPAPTIGPMRVCVIVHTFPVTGGIMTVLNGITQVTQDIWRMEYLVQDLGPNRESYIIHQFGIRHMGPWHFPI